MSKRKYKYRIGEKLFSRKLGWFLGTFVESVPGCGGTYHIVRGRTMPCMLQTGACMDQPPNRQGYYDVMIGTEAEIRELGFTPGDCSDHYRRDIFAFMKGNPVAFDRFGYVCPGDDKTNCEGTALQEEQGARYVQSGSEYVPNPNYVGYKVRVLAADIESVLAKLRQRAVDAVRAGVHFINEETGLPRDIKTEPDEQGMVLTLPEDGICGGYLFRPILKY